MKYLKTYENYENKQILGIINHQIGGYPYVLGEDGKKYYFGCSHLLDDYPYVGDLDTTEIDGMGSWGRKCIKPYIGMVVRFWIAAGNGTGYSYKIFKDDQKYKQKIEDLNDIDFKARWVYEETYENKKKVFVNDVIEYLTGYFDKTKRYNRKSLEKIIGEYFDHKMDRKKLNYDYNSKICWFMGVKKEDGEYNNQEDIDMIEKILYIIWGHY